MKLYTEEQVRQMIQRSRETGLTAEFLILINTPIELPSDEEIKKESEWLDHPLERLNFQEGMKWMRNKIQGGNK